MSESLVLSTKSVHRTEFMKRHRCDRGSWSNLFVMLACLIVMASGCKELEENAVEEFATDWQVAVDIEDAALLSVHGTAADNVWIVGADDGKGPVVLQFNGTEWTRHDTGLEGDLWWVRAFDDGTVFMAGSDAHVVRYREGTFERLQTPGLGRDILFGIWGHTPDDVYAVGSAGGRNGFIWHFDGENWSTIDLPDTVVLDDQNDLPNLTKVWGPDGQDVWVVGSDGTLLRGNKANGFESIATDTGDLLFAVHGSAQANRVVVVGGGNEAVGLEVASGAAVDNSPADAPLIQGVWVTPGGTGFMSGGQGVVYQSRNGEVWESVEHNLDLNVQSLHSIWVDPAGGIWSVGGNVLVGSLDEGIAIHNKQVPVFELASDKEAQLVCPEEAINIEPDRTIARQWNEQILNAIRRDTPRPTVHSRNLFHLSALLWDVWNAYNDTDASPYLVDESVDSDNLQADMDEAMSYAAYRLLTHRYENSIGGVVTTDCLDKFMGALGLEAGEVSSEGTTPSAVGTRFAEAYVNEFANDGANESNNYADPDEYMTPQPRLIVDLPGSGTDDPIDWQQLVLAEAVTQNGILETSGTREYIGAHWRDVTPFSLVRPADGGPYFSYAGAPVELNDTLIDDVMEVLRKTAWLDINNEKQMDISPNGIGNNPLGTNDGEGYDVNPVTGEPYEPIMASRANFGRVLAEFWADGLDSETPPGHWNTIANHLADDPEVERKLFGQGEVLDPLSWDIHVYFAVNGALHDAAIGAWELKREYVTSRPITLIRTLGTRGQSTDPNGPSYDPDGLPLEEGLVEVITEETAKEGGKHAHLSRYVGEIAVWSWRGEPGDRDTEIGGHGWIRIKDWVSYQRRTFVSPAFPGYASGHSTFSRAAAEVLAELTASDYFPGGSSELTFEPGYLVFEYGPSEPIVLRWATYFDAADQAGASRLWGGIHVAPDDYDGRIMGSEIGLIAVELARQYFEGTVQP